MKANMMTYSLEEISEREMRLIASALKYSVEVAEKRGDRSAVSNFEALLRIVEEALNGKR